MENKQPDFMKNRPVADKANQYKDVYSTQSKSTRTTITALLIVLMTVFSVISLVNQNWVLLGLFAPALAGLIIALLIGRRADRYNMPVKPADNPEAIFKEHEE